MIKKFKTLGVLLLSTIGIIILLLANSEIGNYFEDINQGIISVILIIPFPILVFLAVGLFNKKINGLTFKNYGFKFQNFATSSLLGIGLAIAIMTITLLIANIFYGIKIEFYGLANDFEQPLLKTLSTLLVVSLWEEFYFRGLVFNTFLKNGFSFHFSALLSSVLFSIMHWFSFDMTETSWFWYIGIVFIGYILVYIYTYTNSIWSVVFFHLSWNFISGLMNNSKNEVGFFEITNYAEYSKIIDNIMVVCLGLFLGLLFYLTSKVANFNKIKSYIYQITTANWVYRSAKYFDS